MNKGKNECRVPSLVGPPAAPPFHGREGTQAEIRKTLLHTEKMGCTPTACSLLGDTHTAACKERPADGLC